MYILFSFYINCDDEMMIGGHIFSFANMNDVGDFFLNLMNVSICNSAINNLFIIIIIIIIIDQCINNWLFNTYTAMYYYY